MSATKSLNARATTCVADARAHEATRHAELCRKLDDERAKMVQQREAREADEGARLDAENEAWLSEQRRLAHERARDARVGRLGARGRVVRDARRRTRL